MGHASSSSAGRQHPHNSGLYAERRRLMHPLNLLSPYINLTTPPFLLVQDVYKMRIALIPV